VETAGNEVDGKDGLNLLFMEGMEEQEVRGLLGMVLSGALVDGGGSRCPAWSRQLTEKLKEKLLPACRGKLGSFYRSRFLLNSRAQIFTS
jgi:hypothetical protein